MNETLLEPRAAKRRIAELERLLADTPGTGPAQRETRFLHQLYRQELDGLHRLMEKYCAESALRGEQ